MILTQSAAAKAWIAIITVSLVLLGFGFSRDTAASLRNAVIELELVAEGPTKQFVDFCQEYEYAALPETPRTDIWTDQVLESLDFIGGDSLATADFKVSTMLWCPFPTMDTTVRDALKQFDRPGKSARLAPHPILFQVMRDAVNDFKSNSNDPGYQPTRLDLIRDPEATDNDYGAARFSALARALSRGSKLKRVTVVEGPAQAVMNGLAAKATLTTTPMASTYPADVALLVDTVEAGGRPSATVALLQSDLPRGVRLVEAKNYNRMPLQYAYFYTRLTHNPGHTSYPGVLHWFSTKPTEAIDLAALRLRQSDISDKPIGEALQKIKADLDLVGNTAELFGFKLPMIGLLLASFVLIPLLAISFVHTWLRGPAFPDAIQDLSPRLRATIGIFCISVLPPLSWIACAIRVEWSHPKIAIAALAIGVAWLLAWMLATRKLWRILSVPAPVPGPARAGD